MDIVKLVGETVVVFAAIIVGVRTGGVGIGLWGGVGTAILVFLFGEPIGSPPIDALLIIVAVILATSSVQAAGGIDWMVALAARLIVRRPRAVTVVAPLVSLLFCIGAGTSNILFSLLPVIQEVSERAGVRPSKPISVSVVASSVALACSPVSAAMAAMIAIMDSQPHGWSVLQLLSVTIPAAVIGVTATALVVSRLGGADLRPHDTAGARVEMTALASVNAAVTTRGRLSAIAYFVGVLAVVVFGLFPVLRPVNADGDQVGTATMIQLIMLVTGAVILLIGRPDVTAIPSMTIFRGGMVAAIAFFGLAWMIDTYLRAHTATVEATLSAAVAAWPWTMALAIFAVAVLTTSQSTATRMIVPIGLAAGLPIGLTAGLWVGALGGIYLLPTNGLQIAAASFDTTGTTKLGRRLVDHSFFVPSLLVTVFTLLAGGAIGSLVAW
ncbi:anaerobic C4-dicarboxylate transporter family protein [Microbacterium gorillae]|uniref:anaerobic C4-dicarboxylate transporter family protein n=1 Tax=Microbacterium gorillae TaxID=1231063 RepID=UPI000590F703|nr:anaerobic C4-dicarboxylate transporter family protein [Microbacterium gorillae]